MERRGREVGKKISSPLSFLAKSVCLCQCLARSEAHRQSVLPIDFEISLVMYRLSDAIPLKDNPQAPNMSSLEHNWL
jgi:hypothetical protein